MTSAQLLGRIQAHKLFREDHVPFDSGEALVAASDAQREIALFTHAIQKRVRLITVTGQEFYTFPLVNVSAATVTSPIVITTDDEHNLLTGDSVLVAGILGMLEANGIRQVTRITSTQFSLDDTVGVNARTSGGVVCHVLRSMLSIRSGRKVSATGGVLEVVDMVELDKGRHEFTDNAAESEVLRIGVTWDYPPEMCFQGVPGSAITTEFQIARGPLPEERITEDIDPLLPPIFDNLLVKGTLAFYLSNLDGDAASKAALEAQEKYYKLLTATHKSLGVHRVYRRRGAPPLRMQ